MFWIHILLLQICYASFTKISLPSCNIVNDNRIMDGQQTIKWGDNSNCFFLDVILGDDNCLYVAMEPMVVIKFDQQMNVAWTSQITYSKNLGVYIFNSTAGSLISCYTITGVTAFKGIERADSLKRTSIILAVENSTNSGIVYLADNWLPSKYNSFTIKSQQFQNKNQSSIIVSSSFVMFLTFAPNAQESHCLNSSSCKITHCYDFTSTNFFNAKIVETQRFAHIAMINNVDTNLWYIQLNSDGQIISAKAIGVAFSALYSAAVTCNSVCTNTSSFVMDIIGLTTTVAIIRYDINTNTFDKIVESTPYYPYYFKIYTSSYKYFNSSDIFMYNIETYTKSTGKESYIYIRDRNVETTEASCALYSYSTELSGQSVASVSIPSDIIIFTFGTGSTINSITTSLVISFDLIIPSVTYSNLTNCSTYEVFPNYRVGLNPIAFSSTSYSYVSILELFCVKSGSSLLDVDISASSSETKDVSWLSFNTSSNKLEGTSPIPGTIYYTTLKAKPNGALIEYQLTITINSCADAFCLHCSNNSSCDKCISGYSLIKNKTTCISDIGAVDANTAGTISSAVTATTGVFIILTMSQCLSKASYQNIFTIAEYFQLLQTLLLLSIDFPDIEYYFLKSFKLFNFDMNSIQTAIGINNDINQKVSGLDQRNNKLNNLDYSYNSTIANYFTFIITLIIFAVIHLFLYLASFVSSLNSDLKEHFDKTQNDPGYKPHWLKKIIAKISRFFNRSYYITLFLESFLFMFINCISELSYFKGGSVLSWLSMFGSCTIIIIQFVIIIIIYFSYCIFTCNPYKAVTGPNASLFEGLKLWKITAIRYQIVFLSRRALLSICLILIHSRYFQFALYCTFNFMHFGYIIFEQPFEDIVDNIIYAIVDMSILTLLLMYSLFISNGDSTNISLIEMSKYGEIICWIILVTNMIICAILLASMIFSIYKLINRRIFNLSNRSVDVSEESESKSNQVQSNAEILSKYSEDANVKSVSEVSSSINDKSNFRSSLSRASQSNFDPPIDDEQMIQYIPRRIKYGEFKLTKRWRELDEEEEEKKKEEN